MTLIKKELSYFFNSAEASGAVKIGNLGNRFRFFFFKERNLFTNAAENFPPQRGAISPKPQTGIKDKQKY